MVFYHSGARVNATKADPEIRRHELNKQKLMQGRPVPEILSKTRSAAENTVDNQCGVITTGKSWLI